MANHKTNVAEMKNCQQNDRFYATIKTFHDGPIDLTGTVRPIKAFKGTLHFPVGITVFGSPFLVVIIVFIYRSLVFSLLNLSR